MAKYRVFYAVVVTALFAGYLLFFLAGAGIHTYFTLFLPAADMAGNQELGAAANMRPAKRAQGFSGRLYIPAVRKKPAAGCPNHFASSYTEQPFRRRQHRKNLFFRKEHALLFAGPKVHPTDLRAILLHGGANPFLGLSRALFLYKKGSMQRLYGGPS